YFRLTIPETPRFTMDNFARATADIHGALNTENGGHYRYAVTQQADAPRATRRDFLNFFGQRGNLLTLFCTCWSWFAIGVAFYALGLNASNILEAIEFDGSGVYHNLINLCTGNLILSADLIPGYLVFYLFIDTWGRKSIQPMGFVVLTCLFIIMGTLIGPTGTPSLGQPKTIVFLFLYCLANFPQNFGPHSWWGEIFPTRYRAMVHGISAATEKFGAIVAQVVVFWVAQSSLAVLFGVLAVFMLTGVGSTLLLPETKGISLEVLSNESQEGFMRGVFMNSSVCLD
ncbi:major facilitator superfamily domain-containing protein, partial [Mycena leptocephala]